MALIVLASAIRDRIGGSVTQPNDVYEHVNATIVDNIERSLSTPLARGSRIDFFENYDSSRGRSFRDKRRPNDLKCVLSAGFVENIEVKALNRRNMSVSAFDAAPALDVLNISDLEKGRITLDRFQEDYGDYVYDRWDRYSTVFAVKYDHGFEEQDELFLDTPFWLQDLAVVIASQKLLAENALIANLKSKRSQNRSRQVTASNIKSSVSSLLIQHRRVSPAHTKAIKTIKL